jgi:hypothetical protein
VEPERWSLLGNGSANAHCWAMAHTSHVVTTIEELLEAVFLCSPCQYFLKESALHLDVVWSLQLVSSEVAVRWSPACKDMSSEAEERPSLEAVTEQRD